MTTAFPSDQDPRIDSRTAANLTRLAQALVDQRAARVLVRPLESTDGFWFGGGNMVRLGDGSLAVVGRHRVAGDSRTGLVAGERGAQMAVYRAASFDKPFEKVLAFGKPEVAPAGKEVVSIEGTSLLIRPGKVELYVSSEKTDLYPDDIREYQKPGTGIWTIELMEAAGLDALAAGTARTVLASREPATVHVKDPKAYAEPDGSTTVLFCTHPFSWTCSNTAVAVRRPGNADFQITVRTLLEKGLVWDVAATRVTDRMPVPRVGRLRGLPPLSLYFYDGAECVRQLPDNAKAVRRPRGYSCEEIGGVAVGFDADFPRLHRLSVNAPLFISPAGTGCSRYVSTLVERDAIYATWQQSQDDRSQPLVGHALPMEQVERILAE